LSPLLDPSLSELGIEHGFGLRGDPEPARLERPRQVHGIAVHRVVSRGDAAGVEADAIVCDLAGVAVGVVTADCVPVLLVGESGLVAAAHAGWRGLCAGVVEAAAKAIRGPVLAAAIGPHVGACCYEVDAPVLDAVAARFGRELPAGALRPGQDGHAWLDLGSLVAAELERAGIGPAAVSRVVAPCTACDPERFHSYRRDGPRSGRLIHFVRRPEGGLAGRA